MITWQDVPEKASKMIAEWDEELHISDWFLNNGPPILFKEGKVPELIIPVEEILWCLETWVMCDKILQFKRAFLAALLRSFGITPKVPSWWIGRGSR